MKIQLPNLMALLAGFCLYQPLAANATDVSRKSDTTSLIRKDELKAFTLNSLDSKPELRDDPVERKFYACLINVKIDEVFPTGVNELESSIFNNRWENFVGTHSSGLKMQKCADQAKKQKASQGDKLPTPPLMDIDDLRIDFTSLNGRKVRVQGLGNYVMNLFMIKKNPTDMSPILIDISKIPRDQQRQILKDCSDIMAGCRVTIFGTVGKVSFQNGIVAENVEW